MSRNLTFCLLLLVTLRSAMACAICAPADAQDTLVFRLHAADAAVLAVPNRDGGSFQPVELVKGSWPGASVTVAHWLGDARPVASNRPVLLLYSAVQQSWRGVGSLDQRRAAWLRRVAAMRPAGAGGDVDWHGRLAFFGVDLEDAEPLVAQTAYEEISIAPYPAMRALKPQLVATRVARWLADPALVRRRPLYTLLLGFSGSDADALTLQKSLPRMPDAPQGPGISAMLAAYVELRGSAGVAWIEREYLTNPSRNETEIQAAVLALGQHGGDGVRVPKERVIAAYAALIAGNHHNAGFAASDLANWGRWEFGARYAEILQSGETLAFASRYAMVFYLLRSPRPDARTALESLRVAKRL